jgi:DNA-binding MarR family transcriptional regulator
MEVSSLLQHAVDQQLRDEGGLSYTQFQILAVLGQAPEGQLRMTDIADRLVHSRSGLTYQVAQLAKAGLVARAPSADDERSVNVTATPQGKELLGRVMPQRRTGPGPHPHAHDPTPLGDPRSQAHDTPQRLTPAATDLPRAALRREGPWRCVASPSLTPGSSSGSHARPTSDPAATGSTYRHGPAPPPGGLTTGT